MSLAVCATSGQAQESAAEPTVGLTVYNQDFAIVRERRTMDLPAARSEVRFKDVASAILAASVRFECLKPAGGATVIEQNYEFDLVNAGALLNKYIDKPLAVITRDGQTHDGTLMSFDDQQLVLAGKDGINLLPRGKNVKDIRFSELPAGLLTRPTLVWRVDAQQAGPHDVEVAYRTGQVNWRVDYRAVADADGRNLNLSGWVTVDNRSGKTYESARLKVLAGDVNIVKPPAPSRQRRTGVYYAYGVANKVFDIQLTERTFADYHMYELPRPVTIKDRQIKQLELLDIESIPVIRKYQYTGDGDKVRVVLEFKNAKETREGLGIPLPKGPIRVYQQDADKQEELLGNDSIDHTPKDEKVRIRVGYAFDVRAERVQTDGPNPPTNPMIAASTQPEATVRYDAASNTIVWDIDHVEEQSFSIRLRNHKDVPVQVEVLEPMRDDVNWEIIKHSLPFEKQSSSRISFALDVPANGETGVTYTVRYSW